MATGEASDLYVVDLDLGEEGEPLGEQTWVALFGPIPDTHRVQTGSGATQVYFRYPRRPRADGRPWRNTAKLIGPGIDTRGSQEVLAARAKVSITSVRELEHGQVRPSDRMCRRLAEGLAFDRDALSVAVLDLRLQRAAGESLRRWNRRRPPRVATRRLYAEAAAVLDAEDAAREAEQQVSAAVFLEEFRAQWHGDAASTRPPVTPVEAWPGRWPRVRG